MLVAAFSPMLSWMPMPVPPAMPLRSLRTQEPMRTYTSMNAHTANLIQHSHDERDVQADVLALTRAMRQSELREGAATVVADMEAIDLREAAREAEVASQHAKAENERLTVALQTSMQESMNLRRENHEMALKLVEMRRSNEKLSTIVRHTSSEYQPGMTFVHSLRLCLAHAITAGFAARMDFAWQLRRVAFRVQDLVGVLLYRSLVWRVRTMMVVGRVLDSWKDEQKRKRAGLADPSR